MLTQTPIPAVARPQMGTTRFTPANPPKVGEIVAIHSRGMYRAARVTKVTKTRIETEYTTEGALKESRRIWEMYTSGSYVATRTKQARDAAHRNFAFYASEANPATRKYYADGKYDHPEKLAEAIEIAERGLEAYVTDEVAEVMLTTAAEVAEAQRRGPEGYLTVTRKTVSLDADMGVYPVSAGSN